MVDGDGGRDRKAPMTSRTLSGAKTADAKRIQEEGKSPGLSPLRTSFSCASLKLRAGRRQNKSLECVSAASGKHGLAQT